MCSLSVCLCASHRFHCWSRRFFSASDCRFIENTVGATCMNRVVRRQVWKNKRGIFECAFVRSCGGVTD